MVTLYLFPYFVYVSSEDSGETICVRVCARVSVCMCACVCEHSVAIFGPLYEIWVLVAHWLKSALTTSFVLLERMCEGVGDSMFFFLSWFCASWFQQTYMSLFSCFPRGITFLIQDGQSRYAHVIISRNLITFCARLKVCFTIIFLVLVQSTRTWKFFLKTLYF